MLRTLSKVRRFAVAPGQYGAAAESGDVSAIEEFLIKKPKMLNVPVDERGRSALHVACDNARVAVAEYLLSLNADVTVLDGKGRTLLHAACLGGSVKLVTIMIRRGLVMLPDQDGLLPLHYACKHDNADLIHMLLSDVALRAPLLPTDHNSALLLAAKFNSTQVLEALLKFKQPKVPDLQLQDQVYGNTALHFACWHGNVAMVKLLLLHQGYNHILNKDGLTPLMIARKSGNHAIQSLLLDQTSAHSLVKQQMAGSPHGSWSSSEPDTGPVLIDPPPVLLELPPRPSSSHSQKSSRPPSLRGRSPSPKPESVTKSEITPYKLDSDRVSVSQSHTYSAPPVLGGGLWGGYGAPTFGFQDDPQLVADKLAELTEQIHASHEECQSLRQEVEKYRATTKLLAKERDQTLSEHHRLGMLAAKNKVEIQELQAGLQRKTQALIGAQEECLSTQAELKDVQAELSRVQRELAECRTELEGSRQECESIKNVLRQTIQLVDQQENCPLLVWACQSGNHVLLQALLQNGCSTDKTDQSGSTALHKACANGSEVAVCLLQMAKADEEKTDAEGLTPPQLACRASHMGIVKMLLSSRPAEDKKALVTWACREGTAAMLSAVMSDPDLQIPVNEVDEEGRTLLYNAAEAGNADTANLLCRLGADVNVANKAGHSPLYTAILAKNTDVVTVLINNGAALQGSPPQVRV